MFRRIKGNNYLFYPKIAPLITILIISLDVKPWFSRLGGNSNDIVSLALLILNNL